MDCPLCDEPVGPVDEPAGVPIGSDTGMRLAHRECMLRTVLGGIGHLTDHAYWCGVAHDPDGGMSMRQSGLAVDHWVQVHGTAAAALAPDGPADGEGMQVGGAGIRIPDDSP